ncbi:cupin domain-containing protein [Nesterenkonia ebinurensis]|uniref:cupin domain-containing protein n=1 Tax=Nesterenkonia ebinurensis TaxID=2608252 RepID=UPI00168C0244
MLPGGASHKAPWTHASEECIVVAKGTLTVEVNGVSHELRPGDSCRFDSRLPHRYVNVHEETAEYIVAVTPPNN